MRTNFWDFLVLGVAVAFYGFICFFWFPHYVKPDRRYGRGEPVEVIVPPGLNGYGFARSLEEQGVVEDSAALARWFVRFGIDRKLRPGGYALRPGSAWEVARQIQETRPSTELKTLLPGTYLTDLDSYRSALSDDGNFPPGLKPLLPEDPLARAAYLIPDSYRLVAGFSMAEQLVRAASRAWWDVNEQFVLRGNMSGEELEDLAVLASIVEKEAARDDERARIAGVFQNRLEREMPLQSCATVVFAWRLKGRELRKVRLKDLTIASPFNTYVNKGLPKSPICVPSSASWAAAFEPEKSPYLFFVARGDGGHVFSKTYREHLDAKKKMAQ